MPEIDKWLPISKKEVQKRGWSKLDVVLVSGDAYVDHPSFGVAVIGRLLEAMGLKVAIIPQPNWQDDLRDFKKFGQPRLFFGVTAGNMDSMVNHYTANKRLRSNDAYTPGNQSGFRPDYPTIVYTRVLKQLYPDTPVVIGGIEASLRRVTHFDYWKNTLKPSILAESGADLLLYGMAEQALKELVVLLEKNIPFHSLKTIAQTAFVQKATDDLPKVKKWEDSELASHQVCLKNKAAFAKNFATVERESNKEKAARLLQQVDDQIVVINPPFPVMKEKQLDASFDLPYTRMPHPKYNKRGMIPAYEMIRHSVNIHRGCFGGCSFCTISAHQGKFIQSRSEKSILKEVKQVCEMPDFKGYISDVGGPSANMYKMKGKKTEVCKKCSKPSCIFPIICPNLDLNHRPLMDLYKKVSTVDGVKKISISSGIRYDMIFTGETEKEDPLGQFAYLKRVIQKHTSGRLKVAPEHTSDGVLKLMRKPAFSLFKTYKAFFDRFCKENNLNQQTTPYFISSHPGCELKDMAHLAGETNKLGYRLEQVQDFTPTPMTVSTVMYYSGINPYNGETVFVAKDQNDKIAQRKFFFWYKNENRKWLERMLEKAGLKSLKNQLFKKNRKN